MCLGRHVWARKETLVVMNYVGRGHFGRLSLSYVEGLMLDPMCDTPHVQVTPNALQLSSEVAESVNSIPMRSARSSAVLNTQQAFVSQLLDTVQPTV